MTQRDFGIFNAAINPGGQLTTDASGVVRIGGITLPSFIISPNGNASAIVGVGGSTYQLQSIRRSEALVRAQGICKVITPFNISPASTVNQTYTRKIEIEGHFSGIKIMADNGVANAQTGNKVAVGITETNTTVATTLTTSQNLSAPVINGLSYDSALAASGNFGLKQVLWSGVATYNMPAGNLARQYSLSDWMSMPSIPRADGGTRPLLLIREKPDPVGYNFLVASALTRTPTYENRGRTMIASTYFGDGFTTPNGGHTIGTTYCDTYPIIRFTKPVLSVWSVGDSIMQGNNTLILPDGYSTFVSRACAEVSTLDAPVAYANLSCNAQTADYYWTNAKAILAAGVPPPSILVTSPVSVNDGASTPTLTTLDAQRMRAYDMIATCRTYGIPVIVWMPWLVNENLTDISATFYDSKRKEINAELKAVAADAGVYWLDLSELGNGASPELWAPAYKYDVNHPNELAHDTVMQRKLAAIIGTFNFAAVS